MWKALLALRFRNAFCTLEFCWSSMKRLDLSRWIKLCTCFESLICVSLPKVTYPYYFAALSFTICRNMAQSLEFWVSSSLELEERKIGTYFNNITLKWELDSCLLKGFFFKQGSFISFTNCWILQWNFGLFDQVEIKSGWNWNEGRTFATWSFVTILCLKPGLKVGWAFYLCFSINFGLLNDWLEI